VVRPSVGGVLVRSGGRADEALKAADEAMYSGKACGGGCLVLGEHSPAL
jgi:GGDEF domain-containing protein